MTIESAARPVAPGPVQGVDDGGTPSSGATGGTRNESHPAWSALFAVAALVPLARVAQIGEPASTLGAFLLAFVPFVGTLALVALLQFRRTRPRSSRAWALLWGLLVATGVSSYVSGLLGGPPDWQTVVLVAPIVEELAKGAGLVLLARFGRLRTPVDGIIYALLVGAGFSLLENTFYFSNAIGAELAGEDGVLQDVFVMRGLVSPLAHPIFVVSFALVLGSRWRRNPFALGGSLAFGAVLHGLWNHAALNGIVTALVPHTVAITLALTAAALLCVRRGDGVGTAPGSTGQDAAPDDRNAPRDRANDERKTAWHAALPWYLPEATYPPVTRPRNDLP